MSQSQPDSVKVKKATPGPWKVVGSNHGRPLDELHFHQIVPCDGSIYCVASTWGGPQEADARLIAAAPEMYDVLVHLQNYPNLFPETIAEEIRAAIAKAEGRNE